MTEYISPLIISGVIAGVGFLTKKTLELSVKLLITYIQSLLKQLSDTTTKVSLLDSRMGELTHAMADINKIKSDLNLYYQRLKQLEDKFDKHTHS
jgi:hypothetical protein